MAPPLMRRGSSHAKFAPVTPNDNRMPVIPARHIMVAISPYPNTEQRKLLYDGDDGEEDQPKAQRGHVGHEKFRSQ